MTTGRVDIKPQVLRWAVKRAGGGDFYRNQTNRVGEVIARQVMLAALDGRLSFKEAYSLTGLNGGVFQAYAWRPGIRLR